MPTHWFGNLQIVLYNRLEIDPIDGTRPVGLLSFFVGLAKTQSWGWL
jgi:hypothetical protein